MAHASPKLERRLSEWENEGGATVRASLRPGRDKPIGRNVMTTNAVNALIAVACLVVGLAIGAVTGAWYEGRSGSEQIAAKEAATEAATEARTRTHQAELTRLNARVDLLQIHLRLGRIAMEADHQDYGSAGERAATFFDDLALMTQSPNLANGERAALENVLAARDELIAGLATAQPSAAERLKELYLQLFDVASP